MEINPDELLRLRHDILSAVAKLHAIEMQLVEIQENVLRAVDTEKAEKQLYGGNF